MKRISELLLLMLILGLTNCTTSRPIYASLGEHDYNGRRKVHNPRYQNKLNALGTGAMIGATASGAYLGYHSNLIQYNSADHQVNTDRVANAVVGGLVGFGVLALSNYLIEKHEIISLLNNQAEFEAWTQDFNRHYSLLQSDGLSSGLLIDHRFESRFIIKAFQDARDFFDSFPNSPYKDRIFNQSIDVAERNELLMLIGLCRNCKEVEKAQWAFYDQSSTLEELLEAKKKFPNLDYESDRKGAELIAEFSDAQLYYRSFPNSNYKKEVFVNALKTPLTGNEARQIAKILGEQVELQVADLKGTQPLQRKSYLDVLVDLYEPKNLPDLNSIFRRYDWVEYTGRETHFLQLAWEIGLRYASNGNQFLNEFGKISNDQEYAFHDVGTSRLQTFAIQQLNRIAAKQITIRQDIVKEPNSSGDFEEWRSSFFYDALYVNETGERKFLYHGRVQNASKFDLPVKLLFSADFVAQIDAEIFNLRMSQIMKFFNISEQERETTLGQASQSYTIPMLKAGESVPFAVLFDLGKGSVKQGINIIGLQAYYESQLKNIQVVPRILNQSVTTGQLQKQMFWLDLIDKEMPATKIKELFNYDYDPSNYTITLPTSDDYKEEYGDDCGCVAISDKQKKDFFGSATYYVLKMKNGHEWEYTYLKNGKIEIMDGFLGIGRTWVDSKVELLNEVMEQCYSAICRD